MLLDLLEDPIEIQRICVMGRNCTLKKGQANIECSVASEKQIAEGKLFKGLFSHLLSNYGFDSVYDLYVGSNF